MKHDVDPARMTEDERQILIFTPSGLSFGLALEEIVEVLALPALETPPGLPTVLQGFLILGEDALPVVRLDRLLGLAPVEPDLYSHVIHLKTNLNPFALLVHRAEELVTLPARELIAVQPQDTFNQALQAEFHWQQKIVHLVASDRLLLAQEKAALADFSRMQRERLLKISERAA